MFSKHHISYMATTLLMILCICGPSGCNFPPPPSCEANYLIYKINEANSTPVTLDTIDLPTGCVYTLTKVDNLTNGNNGLPAITSPIIINGHGSTIQRATDALEYFRLFYVETFGQADLTLTELTLSGGYSYNPTLPNNIPSNSGGAIYNGSHLSVFKSTIRRNSGREGGGIFNMHHMTLSDVTIDSNQDYFGLPGGAGIHNRGTAILTNTTISRNGFNPAQPADGIYNHTLAHLEMTNSTISHNAGCGIDNQGGGELVLNHVTMAFNGCGIGSAGDVYASNSIFGEGCGFGQMHPVFPNLSPYPGCGGPVVAFAALELDPLADNGGFTKTHALRPGSVAIDMVVRECLPTDQRGIARPQGPKCDVGAYEYIVPPAPLLNATDTPTFTPTITPTPTLIPQPKACTFTAAVNMFCRSGPGASLYPDVDDFTAGQSAPVVGQSSDGVFVYVEGPNTNRVCTVPSAARFGALNGDCLRLPIFTPPAPPEPTKTEEPSNPPPGCTVRQRTGAIKCVVPCPADALPGEPCSP
jgi:hypothetical protein